MFAMLDILVKVVRCLIGIILFSSGCVGLKSHFENRKDNLVKSEPFMLIYSVVLIAASVIIVFG